MNSIKNVVDSFINESSECSMEQLINCFKYNQAGEQDIAYLAKKLAQSGVMLREKDGPVKADIASTGGPGSLTTIFTPLFLNAFGLSIPKLGVPGRPAGGIDVLAQIPGYRYDLEEKEIVHILSKGGYVHFLASAKYAPLDAKLFEYRKKHGALIYPPLVIASILAKKIAVGVQFAGLDVRVAPHGNFGSSWEAARENAKCFCRVAALVDCNGVCFLTDNTIPPQPYIGRGEALVAVSRYFEGKTPIWLKNHIDMCYAMAKSLANRANLKATSYPSRSDILTLFSNNLHNQGTSFEAFKIRVDQVEKEPTFDLQAQEEGFLEVNIDMIRDIITSIQAQALNNLSLFPDPCGITFVKIPGQYVNKGEQIASIRFTQKSYTDPTKLFDATIRVRPYPKKGLLFEEVSDE